MRVLITVVLLSFVAVPLATAQIVNGSFEPDSPFGAYWALPGGSTSVPGWTTTDTGVEWFDPSGYGVGYAGNGSYAVDIANTVYAAGGIEQTFATVPGSVYQISFLLGTHSGLGRLGTCEISVEADGATQVFTAENYTAAVVWESKLFAFTADDSEATLSFRCTQSAHFYFAYVDGVSTTGTVSSDRASWSEIKSLFR